MITIGALIGSKITKVVGTLGVTVCLFGGTVLFYEGVSFLNWWPANKIPVYGWLVKGEINRRSSTLIDIALEEQNIIFEKKIISVTNQRNKIIDNKNKIIQNITKNGIEAKQSLLEQHSNIVDELREAIRKSNEEKSKQQIEVNDNPLRMRIPSSVYDKIK